MAGADGTTLRRMAELLKVDELRQFTLGPTMKFVVRVGAAREAIEVDHPLRVETVLKVLADAAVRVRRASERERFAATLRDDDVQFAPVRFGPGEKLMLDWIDYQSRAVRSIFVLSSELLVPDPAVPPGGFEIRSESQIVRVVNDGEEPPSAGRFAAIAEEMKNL